MNTELRNHYKDEIIRLTESIDVASRNYIETQETDHLIEYVTLIEILTDLKESIKEMEEGCVR